MPTCFVIQPFSPKFDKRYDDVYKPALEEAGLEPYRVDQDPGAERLIDAIEEQIRNATICLADIHDRQSQRVVRTGVRIRSAPAVLHTRTSASSQGAIHSFRV